MDDRTIPSDLENTVAGLLGRTLFQASKIRRLENDLQRVQNDFRRLLMALSASTLEEGVEIASALIASLDE